MRRLRKLAFIAKSPMWQAVGALVAILALGFAYLGYRADVDAAGEQQRETERQQQEVKRQQRAEIERVPSRVVLSSTGNGADCGRTLCVVVENRSRQDVHGVFLRTDDADPETTHDVPSGIPIGDIAACKAVVLATTRDVTAELHGLSLEFFDGDRPWRKKSPQSAEQSPQLLEELEPNSTLSNGWAGRAEVGQNGVLSVSDVTPCD